MKTPLLSLILFLCSLTGFSQEPVEVMVLMKDQYNRTELCRKAEFIPTKTARRDYVVKELKNFAEASQYDLMLTLNELELQGLVTKVHSLWSANALYFTAAEEVIQTLAERHDIESISPVKQYQWIPEEEPTIVTDAVREITSNIIQVNADQVWAQGNTGQGVVIAVVDSGVNYNHLDLADHLWDGGEAFPHHGYDIVNDDDDPMDDKGHGTHCAGTVCGNGTAGSLTGIAPDAILMCIKSIREDGFGGAVNIAGGMEWAVEHGCDAISMSLGMVNAEVTDKELLRRTCEALLMPVFSPWSAPATRGTSNFTAPSRTMCVYPPVVRRLTSIPTSWPIQADSAASWPSVPLMTMTKLPISPRKVPSPGKTTNLATTDTIRASASSVPMFAPPE